MTQELFTDDERDEVAATFRRVFSSSLRRGERFVVHGSVDRGKLEVSLEIADPDRTEVATFEAGHNVGEDGDLGLAEARAHAVEFLHAAVHSYLTSDRFPKPHIDWREYTFEGHKVFFRGAVVNEALEAEANRILAEAENA